MLSCAVDHRPCCGPNSAFSLPAKRLCSTSAAWRNVRSTDAWLLSSPKPRAVRSTSGGVWHATSRPIWRAGDMVTASSRFVASSLPVSLVEQERLAADAEQVEVALPAGDDLVGGLAGEDRVARRFVLEQPV